MKLAALVLVLCCTGAARAAVPARDPFVRPAPAAAAGLAAQADAAAQSRPEPPKPRLRAIVFARRHALADIEGQVLREGERFGDWRVAGIEERRVRLERGGDELVLRLDGENQR